MLLKKIISLVVCLFLGLLTFSQDSKERDSLLNLIKTTNKLDVKASAHAAMAWFSLYDDINLANKHLDSSFAIHKKINNEKRLAKTYYISAVAKRFQGEYDKAIEHINESLKYVEKVKDTYSIANNLSQKGMIHYVKGDHDKALKGYYRALSMYESIDLSIGIGITHNYIGLTLYDLEQYDKAEINFKEAIKIHDEMNDDENLSNAYNNLARVYGAENNDKLELEYFQKARKIYIKKENSWGIAITSENIGVIFMEQNRNSEAIKYFNEAKNIFERNNYKMDLSRVLTNLGLVYFQTMNYSKSEFYLKKALKTVTNSKNLKKEIHMELSELFEETGRFKLALSHFEKAMKFKDSIFNEDKSKNINELDKKYETAKKDKEIATQQLELKEQESEIQKKKTQNNYMLGSIIFLVLTATLLIFLFKQRQKRKNQEILTLKREVQIKTLESLIEGEEKERHRVAKELHDGVNGDLSAIKYKLSSLLEMNNKVIKEAITMIDDSCKQVRAISHNLVPPSLENFNLIEATEVYCDNLNDVTPDVSIMFQYLGDVVELPKKSEVNAFRIIQELVANAIRHAEASQINVQVSCRDNTVQISVDDNGKGFDKDTVESDGIGLRNVQSRVDYLNATTDFISNQEGTSYTIEIDKEQLNDN